MRWCILHISFWVTAFCLINLSPWTIGIFTAGQPGYWWASLYGSLFNILLFYTHAYYLIPRFLSRKKWPYYLGFTILLLVTCTGLESLLDWVFIRHYPLGYAVDFPELLENNLAIHALFFLFTSYLFRFTQDWFIHERQKQVLKSEKLAAELAFLKTQINPHFLFNTLNNLFASAHQNQDTKTANGIAKLAHIMRYMLEESESDRVPLDLEIEHLKYYLDLQALRLSSKDEVQVTFEYTGETQHLSIPPLLLIPFVENAFKHGISLEQASFIKIHLEAQKDRLLFNLSNSVPKRKMVSIPAGSGIGLQNVKKRLQLLYPGKHQLAIRSKAAIYEIELILELN